VRPSLGRVILVGLEVLIIGDIVRTIVVDPTTDQVLVLGGIVALRIVVSFALEADIDGRWPLARARGRVGPRLRTCPAGHAPVEGSSMATTCPRQRPP
jgi:hypothetical protein